MNGSGHKGGAFGFKISSLNKVILKYLFKIFINNYYTILNIHNFYYNSINNQLVDTKASDNSSITLLHFLATTIEESPNLLHLKSFVDELQDCGSACRGWLNVIKSDWFNFY